MLQSRQCHLTIFRKSSKSFCVYLCIVLENLQHLLLSPDSQHLHESSEKIWRLEWDIGRNFVDDEARGKNLWRLYLKFVSKIQTESSTLSIWMYRIVKTRSRSAFYIRCVRVCIYIDIYTHTHTHYLTHTHTCVYVYIGKDHTAVGQKEIRTSRSAGRFTRMTCTACHLLHI